MHITKINELQKLILRENLVHDLNNYLMKAIYIDLRCEISSKYYISTVKTFNKRNLLIKREFRNAIRIGGYTCLYSYMDFRPVHLI